MDVFAVTVKARIYLLAENETEAELLAQKMTGHASDEMPGNDQHNRPASAGPG